MKVTCKCCKSYKNCAILKAMNKMWEDTSNSENVEFEVKVTDCSNFKFYTIYSN